MTLCFESTSHAAMMTAAAAPHGIIQPAMNQSVFVSMAANIMEVKPARTAPPSAMST